MKNMTWLALALLAAAIAAPPAAAGCFDLPGVTACYDDYSSPGEQSHAVYIYGPDGAYLQASALSSEGARTVYSYHELPAIGRYGWADAWVWDDWAGARAMSVDDQGAGSGTYVWWYDADGDGVPDPDELDGSLTLP